ncbi:hypothetical protein Leryth_023911 [Lithospermum erythrorhizon]|nr:hypothetical protein Leryth_023911 [Lithospermum erythrorhizon]
MFTFLHVNTTALILREKYSVLLILVLEGPIDVAPKVMFSAVLEGPIDVAPKVLKSSTGLEVSNEEMGSYWQL